MNGGSAPVEAPSTHARSLRAALEVVRNDGIEALTTRAIARRSGLTQPAIYRHFSGIDELIRELLGEIRAGFHERLLSSSRAGTPADRLRAAMDVFREFAIEEPRLYDALFLQTADANTPLPPVDPERGGHIFGYLVQRIAACMDAGEMPSEGPVRVALSLAAHAQGLILLYRQGRFGSNERFSEFYRRAMEEWITIG